MSPPPVAVRTPITGVTLTPVALPAVAPPTAAPLRSVAVGSIPAGFEPGERPVGKAFSEFYSAQEGMRLLGRPMGDAFVNGQEDLPSNTLRRDGLNITRKKLRRDGNS